MRKPEARGRKLEARRKKPRATERKPEAREHQGLEYHRSSAGSIPLDLH